MSNARTLADLVSAGNELADGQISVSEISDLTATAAELNTLDGITATAAELNTLDGITATVTELNYMDGATSSIQSQLDNISVTSGSLTKSFANGEQASITLSGAISPTPVVSVTKEVAQTGIVSKGGWDVATNGANYELHDTAYATTLTPGAVGFDLENASYDSVSFSITSQESSPQGLTFKPDGTKMYIVGSNGQEVNEYTLSTAFDITTASFTTNFSIAGQETNPYGIEFNSDGTKMFILGNTGDDVNEYALSTAYDVSSASFTDSFSVSSQDTTPIGLTFNNDGTKMYIVGNVGGDINEYSLSTAFDVSTASFTTNFSVSAQDAAPRGLVFNNDGTKLFLLGQVADEVNVYTLSTAYDISTASYSSVTFSVASEEVAPFGIAFNADGTKMFIVGSDTDTVYQYSTSKDALILGSGSFASTDVGKRIVGNGGEAILTATDGSYSEVTAFNDSSTIASGSWSMFALTFDGTDGVKISGIVNGYDIANASYDSVSFSIAGQEINPTGIAFNNDGTKMFIVGSTGDDVNEYALSTAFDVSTASFDSNFSVASQEATPQGFTFNSNGTKMYIVGTSNDTVYQYSLSTAFDISTASYDSQSFSVTSQASLPTSIRFNTDGTKMYVLDYGTDVVYQYTLASAYLVATASYDSVSFSANSQASVARDFVFNFNGTKMFILDQTTASVFQYSLSTAFDMSTASYDSVSFSVTSQEDLPYGLAFNSNGTTMYVVGVTNDTVYQYSTGSLFTPTSQYHPTVTKTSGQIDTAFWTDINTMTADETLNGGEVYYAVSTDDRTTWAVIDNTDGVRPIVRNNAGTWEYNTAVGTVGFALGSASYDSVSFSVASQDTSPSGITFNNDGTKMYVVGYTNDSIYQYTLSTAYDLSTASYDSVSFSVASQETLPKTVTFNNDGTKMYVVGTSNDTVYQYVLSTAFDLSTASYDNASISVAGQDTGPEDITFNNDGTKMYMVGATNDTVFQYSLSTAYDITTVSYDSVSLNISSQDETPRGLTFNNDGTILYIAGESSDSILQYNLSTAFNLSTATYGSVSFSVASQDDTPTGVAFNSNGTKMYVTGRQNDTVYQYSTSGPAYTTSTTWTSATTNEELYALQEALTTTQQNRMNSTQLNAVTDPNHYALGDTLDLAIMLYTASAGSIPESDGVSINYDAEALNKGAVLGTDYDYDFPDSTTVRITSNAAQNLKVRVV